MKEYRVFVGDVEIVEENCLIMEEWYEHEDEYGTLHPDAEIWIQDAEINGTVYSLAKFSLDYNYNEMDYANTYIYITNKY